MTTEDLTREAIAAIRVRMRDHTYREAAFHQCSNFGHDLEAILRNFDPVRLWCARCGASWPVASSHAQNGGSQ